MKEMGLKSYRFSVNWCRIVPEPGKKNPRGIAFYKNLVKEIRAAGMEPLVTLYHWDLPLWAHKKGGWKNPKIVDWYLAYVRIMVDALSEDVQYWMTFNEPQVFIMMGYVMVTENGMAANDAVGSDGCVHDGERIDFLKAFLPGVGRAIDEGIPVLGYQHWSVMDNMEWCEGYGPRFGLIHVDYQTQKRTIKDSGRFYADVIRTNGENLK